MKKEVFLVFLILLCGVFSFVSAECVDNDGGKDYDVTSSVLEFGNSLSFDNCINANTLSEFFCEGDAKQSESYDCPNGCFAGHCLKSGEIGEVFLLKMEGRQEIYFNGIPYEITTFGCTGMNPPRNMVFRYSLSDGSASETEYENGFQEPRQLENGVSVVIQGCGGNIINLAMSSLQNIKDVKMSAYTDKQVYYDSVGENMISVSTKLPKFMDCKSYFISPNNEEIFISSGGCLADGHSLGYAMSGEYGTWKVKFILTDSSSEYTVYSNDFQFLKKIEPTNETGPIIIPTEIKENYVCNGCALDSNCYFLGYRKDGTFCSENKSFVMQLESDVACENNFECSSNVCAGGKCVSAGLIQKILNWFKNLFG